MMDVRVCACLLWMVAIETFFLPSEEYWRGMLVQVLELMCMRDRGREGFRGKGRKFKYSRSGRGEKVPRKESVQIKMELGGGEEGAKKEINDHDRSFPHAWWR